MWTATVIMVYISKPLAALLGAQIMSQSVLAVSYYNFCRCYNKFGQLNDVATQKACDSLDNSDYKNEGKGGFCEMTNAYAVSWDCFSRRCNSAEAGLSGRCEDKREWYEWFIRKNC
ncbi:hypothetical protein PTMSG1_06180 [Pyrenophora teres f. maculata]|nr:hypothetical protein PTMSG1_06180 [Pyrenophora teres f. maculata]